MNGEKRRELILEMLQTNSTPLSGSELAKRLGITRQVIVHDIALLRAANQNILSTHRGYILNNPTRTKRVFKVKHSGDQIADELNVIVDAGGRILDVFVEHKLYGEIKVPLSIASRKAVQEFIDFIATEEASPLSQLTDEFHFHTVEADSEEILDAIEMDLKEKGYLVP